VFHSEADFQHALAMQIANSEPRPFVRPEFRPVNHERVYLDLWVEDGPQKLAIELKYKTRRTTVEPGEERFDLANHGAQDLGAYDVWKDVQRIETVCAHRPDVEGYVIFLTNDSTYWTRTANDGTVGADFRLYEGRISKNELQWASHAGAGTMKSRETPIVLAGSYRIVWNDYSRLGESPGLAFRYTIIPVKDIPLAVEPEPTRSAPASLSRPPVRRGHRPSKYSPLHDFLLDQRSDRVDLTYSQIEEILGASLPPSSRDHAPMFWANHYGGTHVWATQWMDAGWKVAGNNGAAERVTFVRISPPKS
jgi:hypothetical protein